MPLFVVNVRVSHEAKIIVNADDKQAVMDYLDNNDEWKDDTDITMPEDLSFFTEPSMMKELTTTKDLPAIWHGYIPYGQGSLEFPIEIQPEAEPDDSDM